MARNVQEVLACKRLNVPEYHIGICLFSHSFVLKVVCLLQEHHPWQRLCRECQQGNFTVVQGRGAGQLHELCLQLALLSRSCPSSGIPHTWPGSSQLTSASCGLSVPHMGQRENWLHISDNFPTFLASCRRSLLLYASSCCTCLIWSFIRVMSVFAVYSIFHSLFSSIPFPNLIVHLLTWKSVSFVKRWSCFQ